MATTTKALTPNGKTVFSIDDGTREITLVNPYGMLICKIHFRPSDISIMDRYNQLTADFDKIIAPIAKTNIQPDGTASENATDEEWAALKEVESTLIQRINALLDTKDAGEIFKTRNAFSSVGGTFFVERVLDAIGNVILAYMQEETELSKARIAKYTEDLNADEVSGDAGRTADNA